jgi:hypothetical protein
MKSLPALLAEGLIFQCFVKKENDVCGSLQSPSLRGSLIRIVDMYIIVAAIAGYWLFTAWNIIQIESFPIDKTWCGWRSGHRGLIRWFGR